MSVGDEGLMSLLLVTDSEIAVVELEGVVVVVVGVEVVMILLLLVLPI